jgi:hypothetical protein
MESKEEGGGGDGGRRERESRGECGNKLRKTKRVFFVCVVGGRTSSSSHGIFFFQVKESPLFHPIYPIGKTNSILIIIIIIHPKPRS